MIVVLGWGGILGPAVPAQDNVAQALAVLDEKVDRLRAQVEDLQFRQQKMQAQLDDLQAQVTQLRRVAPGATDADLQALETKIQAVDAARERDKQIILDQLSRELAALSSGRGAGGAGGSEHVVQKGETLATIAKQYGVTIAEVVKANAIANPDEIRIGQKLLIPGK